MNETIAFITMGYVFFSYVALIGWAIAMKNKLKKMNFKRTKWGIFGDAYLFLFAPFFFPILIFLGTSFNPKKQTFYKPKEVIEYD